MLQRKHAANPNPAPEKTVGIQMLKHVRIEITLDEIAGCVIAVSNYSNIGEKIGNTTRKKATFAGFEPGTSRDRRRSG